MLPLNLPSLSLTPKPVSLPCLHRAPSHPSSTVARLVPRRRMQRCWLTLAPSSATTHADHIRSRRVRSGFVSSHGRHSCSMLSAPPATTSDLGGFEMDPSLHHCGLLDDDTSSSSSLSSLSVCVSVCARARAPLLVLCCTALLPSSRVATMLLSRRTHGYCYFSLSRM